MSEIRIETERLVLRRMRDDDLADYLEARGLVRGRRVAAAIRRAEKRRGNPSRRP